MKLLYEGSVKNLWEVDREHLEFEYTDAYSVFDWGRMPDELPYKGESLAALGAYFFTAAQDPKTWVDLKVPASLQDFLAPELAELKKSGLHHHYIRRSAPNKMVVRRVSVVGPDEKKLLGRTLYHYKRSSAATTEASFIPLEVVFRLGVPKGSSLIERLTPEYSRELGFSTPPKEGTKFEAPVIEFFTKLEDTDRFLSWGQALNYSGIDFTIFEKLVRQTMLLSLWLARQFEARGLELWDGKFEWAVLDGKLALVDSIGPDELRILDPKTGTQISKEFLRHFYRRTPWYKAITEAKQKYSTDWKQKVTESIGGPPRLDDTFKKAATALYPSLALAFTGENPGNLGISLPEMLKRIQQCL